MFRKLIAATVLAAGFAAAPAFADSCQDECEEVCVLFFDRGTQQWAECVVNCVEYGLCSSANAAETDITAAALAMARGGTAPMTKVRFDTTASRSCGAAEGADTGPARKVTGAEHGES